MRGTDRISGSLSSHGDIDDRIPARQPLRQVKRLADEALASLDAVRPARRGGSSASERAGAAHAGQPDPDPGPGALRAAVDGADAVQPALPLGRRPRHR
jgi:hypothetical protein